jgi:hypothetical protein
MSWQRVREPPAERRAREEPARRASTPGASPRRSVLVHQAGRLGPAIGNAQLQRFLVQRAPEDEGQTMDEIVASMSVPGAPPPVETFVAAILRESADAGLALYLDGSKRGLIQSAYREEDARRILGVLLRKPYTPGAQSILYQYLDKPDKDEVDKETNDRFVGETGITGPLDWKKAADKPFARCWMMLRDDVMDDRAAAEEAEEDRKFKADLLAKAGKPSDLHAALKGLDLGTRLKLIKDSGFKKDLKDALGDWDEFAGCIEDMGGQAPDKAQLMTNKTVLSALSKAWKDSLPGSSLLAENRDQLSTRNHEEGGWVYVNLVTNSIVIRRQSAEDHTNFETDSAGNLMPWISLELPPKVDNCVLVANFHTHPNQGKYDGASANDGRSIDGYKIPGLLRDSQGNGAYGSVDRRASLQGSQTYPE